MINLSKAIFTLFLALICAPAWGHGLLVSAEASGNRIEGRVYYSDGTPGAGEYVELKSGTEYERVSNSAATDGDGRFSFESVSGQQYLIVAHGEEGHTTELEITVRDGARGQIVDKDLSDPQNQTRWIPPAWMLIGGLFALSLVPAFFLRLKGVSRRQGAQ